MESFEASERSGDSLKMATEEEWDPLKFCKRFKKK